MHESRTHEKVERHACLRSFSSWGQSIETEVEETAAGTRKEGESEQQERDGNRHRCLC